MSTTLPTLNTTGVPAVSTLVSNLFGLVNSVTTSPLPVTLISAVVHTTEQLTPAALPSLTSAVLSAPTTLGFGGLESGVINTVLALGSSLDAVSPLAGALASGQTPVLTVPVLNIQIPLSPL